LPESKTDLQLRIVRRLLTKIADGEVRTGQHLGEIELSQAFGVSRTPIRAALAQITSLGAAERGVGRGLYVVATAGSAEQLLAALPQEDDEQVKEQIARDWFQGHIPREVSENFFHSRYGLGKRSRVLQMLLDEGVVSRMPGYRWQFEPTLNTQEANDASYNFRLLIEPGAILQSTFAYDQQAANAIRTRHERVLSANTHKLSELFRLDEEFHLFIAECSKNAFVVQSVVQQNKLRRLLEYASLIDQGRLNASCMEHISILGALDDGNLISAAELMKRHLLNAMRAPPAFDL
jgi:DNA-binding GntR family transcriptional regulator